MIGRWAKRLVKIALEKYTKSMSLSCFCAVTRLMRERLRPLSETADVNQILKSKTDPESSVVIRFLYSENLIKEFAVRFERQCASIRGDLHDVM